MLGPEMPPVRVIARASSRNRACCSSSPWQWWQCALSNGSTSRTKSTGRSTAGGSEEFGVVAGSPATLSRPQKATQVRPISLRGYRLEPTRMGVWAMDNTFITLGCGSQASSPVGNVYSVGTMVPYSLTAFNTSLTHRSASVPCFVHALLRSRSPGVWARPIGRPQGFSQPWQPPRHRGNTCR